MLKGGRTASDSNHTAQSVITPTNRLPSSTTKSPTIIIVMSLSTHNRETCARNEYDTRHIFCISGRTHRRFIWIVCAVLSLLSSRHLLVEQNLHFPLQFYFCQLAVTALMIPSLRGQRENTLPHPPYSDTQHYSARGIMLLVASMCTKSLSVICALQATLHFRNLPTLAMMTVTLHFPHYHQRKANSSRSSLLSPKGSCSSSSVHPIAVTPNFF